MHPLTEEINKLNREKNEKINKINSEWATKIQHLRESCSHKYEDGTSAISENVDYRHCVICGRWV